MAVLTGLVTTHVSESDRLGAADVIIHVAWLIDTIRLVIVLQRLEWIRTANSLSMVLMRSFVQVAQVDGWHDGALAILLEVRHRDALSDDIGASVDILLLVNASIGPNQKDRKFLNDLAQVLISDHSHPVFLNGLLELLVLNL